MSPLVKLLVAPELVPKSPAPTLSAAILPAMCTWPSTSLPKMWKMPAIPNGCFAATSSMYFLISSNFFVSSSSSCSTFSVSTLMVGFLVVVDSVWSVFSGEEVSVLSVVGWSLLVVTSLVVASSTVVSCLSVFSVLLISVAVSTSVDCSIFEVWTSVVDSGAVLLVNSASIEF